MLRLGRIDSLYLLKHPYSALNLLGTILPGSISLDESLDLPDSLLLTLVGSLINPQTFLSLPLVVIIIPAIADQLSSIDFHDSIDHVVQKHAIMRRQNKGRRIPFQVVFHPDERFQIQMVGGLVEKDQIGL